MKKGLKKLCSLVLLIAFTVSILTGCKSGSQGNSDATSTSAANSTGTTNKEELYKYNVYYTSNDILPWFDNSKDVVTPYVENKFNMKINEIVWTANQPNRINTLIATNSLPEVMVMDVNFVMDLISKGVVADLTELIPKHMPNYWNNYMSEVDKPYNYVNGKMYYVYKMSDYYNTVESEYEDIYGNQQWGGHCPLVREDILKKCGYEFTPFKDVERVCKAENRVPTAEEMQITPAIKTPEDFYQFLVKIKKLDMKSNDLPVIPWSATWSIFHFGTMFDFGHWKWNTTTKTSDGYLGAPGAKDYMKFIYKAYNEGLLDKNFLVQKENELTQKVSSGRVAAFMSDVGDTEVVQKALYELDPSYTIRPIPWPRNEEHGYLDCYVPGWYAVCINKDVPEDKKIRLLKMWDWLYSDEGYDTLVWGPKEAGLYEEKDGKKIFKDPNMWEIAKSRKAGAGGPDEYGLHSLASYGGGCLWSKIANCSGGPSSTNKKGIDRSYPVVINVFKKFTAFGMIGQKCENAQASYGADEVVGKTSTFYWTDFGKSYLPKLLVAKSDEEFNNTWNGILAEFKKTAEYDRSKTIMDEWFKKMGNK